MAFKRLDTSSILSHYYILLYDCSLNKLVKKKRHFSSQATTITTIESWFINKFDIIELKNNL